uniref:Uncharacterized protein n=1 Tax=Anguilla anguilla TaxID=7936 RepID=A0A0E9QB24_ANGAN
MSYLTSVNFSYTFQNGIRGRLFKIQILHVSVLHLFV